MNFNFVIGTNPKPSWDPLGDLVHLLGRAIEACGHCVLISDSFVMGGAINIFLDRIHYFPELIRDLVTRNVTYGIVFTEMLDSGGRINWGAEEEEIEDLGPGLEQASFIWCLLEESVPAVRAYNGRACFLPFGYAENMDTLKRLPKDVRDIDFLMTGIITPRRTELLGKLGGQGFRTHSANMVPRYIRDALLARSHVNISVNKFDGPFQIVSVTRVCHSIVNRVPVVLETPDASGPYAKYCLVSDAPHIVDDATNFVRNANIDEFAEDMLSMFKQNDMSITMRELISRI